MEYAKKDTFRHIWIGFISLIPVECHAGILGNSRFGVAGSHSCSAIATFQEQTEVETNIRVHRSPWLGYRSYAGRRASLPLGAVQQWRRSLTRVNSTVAPTPGRRFGCDWVSVKLAFLFERHDILECHLGRIVLVAL